MASKGVLTPKEIIHLLRDVPEDESDCIDECFREDSRNDSYIQDSESSSSIEEVLIRRKLISW